MVLAEIYVCQMNQGFQVYRDVGEGSLCVPKVKSSELCEGGERTDLEVGERIVTQHQGLQVTQPEQINYYLVLKESF